MPKSSKVTLFVGTYTRDSSSEGIYSCLFDTKEGNIEIIGTTGGLDDPSFIAIHPRIPVIYAVAELLSSEGTVVSYRFNESSGSLELLNSRSTGSSGPCHVLTDTTGSCLLVTNYAGGSAASFPIVDDGSLGDMSCFLPYKGGSGIVPSRQLEPHPHSSCIDPSGRFAYIADLGHDKVRIYTLNTRQGLLTANADRPFYETMPGGGPRHMDFHPNGSVIYVLNEIGSTVEVCSFDSESGGLSHIQTVSTLPDTWKGTSHCADIHVHPNGRYVYASNRGHDSIAVFSVEAEGLLRLEGCDSTLGECPRNFALSPVGDILLAANQDTHSVFSFRLDETTGRLVETLSSVHIPKPVCLRFRKS